MGSYNSPYRSCKRIKFAYQRVYWRQLQDRKDKLCLHYQDNHRNCIFRYDNAIHKPALGFKEHKHTKDEPPIEVSLPDISDIVDEVIRYL